MATSKEAIVSSAYVQMGESPISSFTENTTAALIASNIYPSVFDNVLALHPWNFATRSLLLSRLSETPTDENYEYGFQLPSDVSRIVTVSAGQGDYTINGDVLLSNEDSLILEYIYTVTEKDLPGWYVKLLEYSFASEAAIAIAKSKSLSEFYTDKAARHLIECRRIDAVQQPEGGYNTSSSFTRSSGGGYSRSRR